MYGVAGDDYFPSSLSMSLLLVKSTQRKCGPTSWAEMLKLFDKKGTENMPKINSAELRAEYTPGWGELSRLGRKYGVSRVTVKNIVSMRYRNG